MRRLLPGLIALLAAASLTGAARAETAASHVRGFQAGLLDTGSSTSCAVLEDGTAACWGLGGAGQLGVGVAGDQGSPTPVVLPPGRRARAIASGEAHSCVLLDDASVACAGSDSVGEQGDGAAITPSLDATPVALAGRRAVAVALGANHACAVLEDGGIDCWGNGVDGRTGDGSSGTDPRRTPVAVLLPAGRRAIAIAGGESHTCAILDDASAWCWGDDFNGALGDDATSADQLAPVRVALPAGRTAVAIAAGTRHTCAILDDGSASCWGRDAEGQLGDDGALAGKPTPVAVALPAGRTAVAIAAGGEHSCAVLDDGRLACWGSDARGELGNDAPLAASPLPVAVALPAGRVAVAIAAGQDHTCAALDDGSVHCWGSDQFGQLGDGASPSAQQPIAADAVPALAPSSTIGRSADVSLALEGAPTRLVIGSAGAATVRVRNAGPDAATGLRVLIESPLLALAAVTVGQGGVTGGTWDVGTLAPGAAATLDVALTALAPGAGSVAAELVAAGRVDPDSSPANGIAGEDDAAGAAIAIAAPAPPAPPPPAPGPAKVAPQRLTLVVTPRRDATAPHATRASGRLVADDVPTRTACAGTVAVVVKAGARTLITRTATLAPTDGACGYAASIRLTAKQRGTARSVSITATFPGNDALLPATARPRTVKLA